MCVCPQKPSCALLWLKEDSLVSKVALTGFCFSRTCSILPALCKGGRGLVQVRKFPAFLCACSRQLLSPPPVAEFHGLGGVLFTAPAFTVSCLRTACLGLPTPALLWGHLWGLLWRDGPLCPLAAQGVPLALPFLLCFFLPQLHQLLKTFGGVCVNIKPVLRGRERERLQMGKWGCAATLRQAQGLCH